MTNENEILNLDIKPPVPDLDKMSPEQIRAQIWEYLKRSSISKQSLAITGPTPPADIDKFYDMLVYATKTQQQKDGDPHPIAIVENYPPTYKLTETLSFTLRRREPATFSQDQPFSGKKNYKPILRENYPDPDNEGYEIQVFGLLFDNLIEIMCWASTNKEANKRALWVEQMMLAYAWYFRYNGISQLLYMGREADKKLDVENTYLAQRPLLYYVRTEKLYTVKEKTIEDILFKVQLDTDATTVDDMIMTFSSNE